MVNVRQLPYVIPHSMSRTSEESDEQTPHLPEGLLLLRIAAAVPPLPAHLRQVPLALFALMVPSYLLRGYFAPAFGNPVTWVAVEGPDRILSELAVRGHLEVTVEDGKLLYSFWGEHGA